MGMLAKAARTMTPKTAKANQRSFRPGRGSLLPQFEQYPWMAWGKPQ